MEEVDDEVALAASTEVEVSPPTSLPYPAGKDVGTDRDDIPDDSWSTRVLTELVGLTGFIVLVVVPPRSKLLVIEVDVDTARGML